MARQLNIAMAQLNLPVGDVDGNASRIIDAAAEAAAAGAGLVVFPELALTGYPPEDLLLRPSLGALVDRALERILAAGPAAAVAFGLPRRRAGRLRNSLAVVRGGELLAVYDKQRLPNYQVFDERRYFAAGDGPCVLSLEGCRVAFAVCEDLWEPGPAAQARAAGARLLVSINASPYHAGKLAERREVLARRAREGGFPIVYVNMVGGQDELVFDGGSMAVDADGACRVQASCCAEGLHQARLDVEDDGRCRLRPGPMAPAMGPEEEAYRALVLGVRDYARKNGFAGAALGLSGGVDSALTLAVAADALGAERVKAVMMPSEHTSALSLELARRQAAALGVDYREIPIGGIHAAFMEALAGEFAGVPADVSEQNLQARARGTLLMAISNKKGLLVLTAGNKSELAVGYATLYGDMAGGFNVLKDVPKTQVYRLAEYRNALAGAAGEAIPRGAIDRPPSAELAPGQLDRDSLPEYETLDRILERYVERDQSAAEIVAAGFDEPVVRRVLRMVDRSEYKRRQSPVGPRLTRRGFGRDRRYPIASAWPPGG